MMIHVMIPYKWKRFIYHVGRARDQYSIAEIGLVAGRQERKAGRQTIFSPPLHPFNSGADEAESITDITKPRKYSVKFIGDLNKMQYRLVCFAQNTEVHMSGKKAKLHD